MVVACESVAGKIRSEIKRNKRGKGVGGRKVGETTTGEEKAAG